MWRFIVRFFAVIGFFALLAAAGGGYMVYRVVMAEPEAPDRFVLALDFRTAPRDGPAATGLPFASESGPTLHRTVTAIRQAADDPRVVGLSARFSDGSFDLTTAQELRDALAAFRESGKFTLAYAETLGFGSGDTAYLLSSAFEEVWLHPVGSLGLSGIDVSVPFAREALDDLGVEPEFRRHGPYKTMPETFTEYAFTPEHREMMRSLADDMFGQLIQGIAASRDLPEDLLEQLVDSGPFTADEAMVAGLVDRLGDARAFQAAVDERTGEDTPAISPGRYLAFDDSEEGEAAARIALIHAQGAMLLGESGPGTPVGMPRMGADTVTGAIRGAMEDDSIDAIVVRIDTGGGSAVAAALISEAIEESVALGKPVVVSMGRAAASGGYYLSTHATAIVAQPGTLTGSIGVYAGKFVTRDLWSDFGVRWQSVREGRNAGMWSPLRPFGRTGEERLETLVDTIYDQFLNRVAEGRDMPLETVRGMAEGRVWTGAQALDLGLVDQLGGQVVAVQAALEAAGFDPAAEVALVPFPEPPSLMEQIAALASGDIPWSDSTLDELASVAPILQHLDPVLQDPANAVMRMPPILINP